MKNKIGIIKFFLLSLLVISAITDSLSSVNPVSVASAAGCSYAKEEYYVDKPVYQKTDTVTFYAKIKREGDLSQCENRVRFNYYVRLYKQITETEGTSYYNKNEFEWKRIGYEDISFSGSYATSPKEVKYNLGLLDLINAVPDPTKIDFSLVVTKNYSPYSVLYGSGYGTYTVVQVAGVSQLGGSGYILNLALDPLKVPYRYPDDKQVNLYVTLSNADRAKVNYNVVVVTKIGDKEFNRKNVSGQNLVEKKTTVAIPINSTILKAMNEVVVTISPADSPESIAGSGKINLAVSGLPGGTPPAGGKEDPEAGKDPGTGGPGVIPPGKEMPENTGGVNVKCDGPNPDPKYCLYNPLPTGELTNMFLWIARGFLALVAIWSVIFIIYGGFRMVMAAGDEEAYTQAKTTITWAILGLVVAALSFSIVAIVRNFLGADIKGDLNF